jgi:acetyl-CoA carboxylase carboxyl transferase subunit alpha
MGVTSERLQELGIVDLTIPEPLGGAHRDVAAVAASIKAALIEQIDRLSALDPEVLVEGRYERLMAYGQ